MEAQNMSRKTHHAYSTSISGLANASRPEVKTNTNQRKAVLAASAFAGIVLTLGLFLGLISVGFSAQSTTTTAKGYIERLDKDYI
jgi:hypothetical protein